MMLVSGLGFGSTGAISRSIDADAWQLASWRSLLGGGATLVYVWLRGRLSGSAGGSVGSSVGPADSPARGSVSSSVSGSAGSSASDSADSPARGSVSSPADSPARGSQARLRLSATLGPQGLLLVGLSGVSMILYIDALQRTEVANVSVIAATVPFLAAGLAWLILRERLRRSTVAAGLVALGGVTLTVAGNLGPGDLDGNLRAVVLALTLALLIVLIRRFEGADAVLALGLAGVLLFVVAMVVADPLGVAAGQMPMLVFFGAVFAVSLVLWTEGVRLIPAAEAGLLTSSETPFSILLAWIVLAEAPPLVTVVGGLLVLGAIFGHAGADLAAGRVSRPWLRPRTRPRL